MKGEEEVIRPLAGKLGSLIKYLLGRKGNGLKSLAGAPTPGPQALRPPPQGAFCTRWAWPSEPGSPVPKVSLSPGSQAQVLPLPLSWRLPPRPCVSDEVSEGPKAAAQTVDRCRKPFPTPPPYNSMILHQLEIHRPLQGTGIVLFFLRRRGGTSPEFPKIPFAPSGTLQCQSQGLGLLLASECDPKESFSG